MLGLVSNVAQAGKAGKQAAREVREEVGRARRGEVGRRTLSAAVGKADRWMDGWLDRVHNGGMRGEERTCR